MFSLLSWESGCCVLCASISWERRSAHAMPAGPPPTMTTSAGICGRSTPSMGLRKISISFEFQVSEFQVWCEASATARPLTALLQFYAPGIDSLRSFSHPRTSEDFFFQLFKLGLSKKVQINGQLPAEFAI